MPIYNNNTYNIRHRIAKSRPQEFKSEISEPVLFFWGNRTLSRYGLLLLPSTASVMLPHGKS
jgi:hypothetical protein